MGARKGSTAPKVSAEAQVPSAEPSVPEEPDPEPQLVEPDPKPARRAQRRRQVIARAGGQVVYADDYRGWVPDEGD